MYCFVHRIGKTGNEPSLRLGAAGHSSKRRCPTISDSDPYSSLSFSPVAPSPDPLTPTHFGMDPEPVPKCNFENLEVNVCKKYLM